MTHNDVVVRVDVTCSFSLRPPYEGIACSYGGSDTTEAVHWRPAIGRDWTRSQMTLAMRPLRPYGPLSVFVAYSHADEPIRRELETHLAALTRSGLLAIWHDRMLTTGTDWRRELSDRIDTCDAIILLISADFIASDYCYGVEMSRALERYAEGSAIVVPVIARPCYWALTPISTIQAAPTDGRAITTWTNRDEALLDVAKHLHRVVQARAPKPTVSGEEVYSPSALMALRINHLVNGGGDNYDGSLPPHSHLLMTPDAGHIGESVVVAGFLTDEAAVPVVDTMIAVSATGGSFAPWSATTDDEGTVHPDRWESVQKVAAWTGELGYYVAKLFLEEERVIIRAEVDGWPPREAVIHASLRRGS